MTTRNIILEQDVLDFLDREDKDSLRVLLQGGSAWSGAQILPVVKVGKPLESRLGDYEIHEVQGKQVFLNRFMDFSDEIIISYVKTPFAESLNVKGVS